MAEQLDMRYAEDRIALQQECENLKRITKQLISETEQLTKQLEYARKQLVECEERNRKLDWLLTQAVERRF